MGESTSSLGLEVGRHTFLIQILSLEDTPLMWATPPACSYLLAHTFAHQHQSPLLWGSSIFWRPAEASIIVDWAIPVFTARHCLSSWSRAVWHYNKFLLSIYLSIYLSSISSLLHNTHTRTRVQTGTHTYFTHTHTKNPENNCNSLAVDYNL